MIVALVCLLSISVFADDEVVQNEVVKTESDVYGTVIRLNFDPGLDDADQYVSTLNKIVDAGTDKDALCILTDGTYYYVFPSSYIVNEISNGKFEIYAEALYTAMQEFNTEMETDYYDEYAITGTWGNRRLNEIVRFEFTTDVTWVDRDHCCMRSYPSLKEVRIGHAINFARARSMFSGCKVLETVIGLENVTNLESDTSQFQSCEKLSYVKLPANLTKIPSYMFAGCKALKNLETSHLTQLTTIGASAFQDSLNLNFVLPDSVTTIESQAFRSAVKSSGSFVINETSQLQTIGANAFNDCRVLKSIYIPSTVTSIGDNAFYQCYAMKTIENLENCQVTSLGTDVFYYVPITSIKLPKGLTTLGAAFRGNEKLATVYLPDTITSIADTFTGTQPTKAVYIYTGSSVSALSACTRIAGAKAVKYDYSKDDEYYLSMPTNEDPIIIVYDYSVCKAFYANVHNYANETGDCMDGVKCERCPSSLEGTTGHTNYERVTFESLTSNGVREYGCSNDGCTKYDVSETLKPVFTAKGYSTNPDKNAINGGYTVDLTSLALYEKFIGEITYGIVIANASSFGEKTFLDQDNKVNSDKALQVEMDKQYSSFDCSINFGTNTGIDLDLVICAYVIEGDTVTYIQSSTGNDVKIGDTTFKSVTLAQVIALVPAESKEN